MIRFLKQQKTQIKEKKEVQKQTENNQFSLILLKNCLEINSG
jgi:hypothetical protein